MSNILVLYASSHGTTKRIATRIADRLRGLGHHVDLCDARAGAPALAGYDAVILGSRVHRGKYARAVRRFVTLHRRELEERECAFFSVSMSAARGGKDPALPQFLRLTRWRPALATSLAGALPYTRYNPLLRLVMRQISRKAGHTTDTSRDHSFTDWDAVTSFADTFDRRLGGPDLPSYPEPSDPPSPPHATIDPAELRP